MSSSQQALFSSRQLWPLPADTWNYFADVSGDTKSDATYRVGDRIRFFQSTGPSFVAWPGELVWLTSYDYQLADVSGDGKADVIGIGPNGEIMVSVSMGTYFASGTVWNYWNLSYDHQFADVNDDGRADIIGVGPSGEIMVALSTGSSFASGSVWQYWSPSYSHHFVDLNDDDMADAIGWDYNTHTNVVVALSNGTSFVGPAVTWATWNPDFSIHFVDIDADGKGDLVGGLWNGDLKVAFSTGTQFSPAVSLDAQSSTSIAFADVGGDSKIDLIDRGSGIGGGSSVSYVAVRLGN
ncbi:MAG TPA: hypothetical protein VJV79_23770 [Polyangiaceae bacterium]|nr:hypothetical protein [Polyangiaceae bacterium]